MTLTMAEGLVVPRGGGKGYWFFDHRLENKGSGVIEFVSPKMAEVAAHVHRNDDELHYLLEGSARYTFGDTTMEAGPGSLIFLPRQVPHSLVFGDEGGRWLWLTRGQYDDLFEEDIVIAATEANAQAKALEVSEERVVEVFAKYGMDFLPPEGEEA